MFTTVTGFVSECDCFHFVNQTAVGGQQVGLQRAGYDIDSHVDNQQIEANKVCDYKSVVSFTKTEILMFSPYIIIITDAHTDSIIFEHKISKMWGWSLLTPPNWIPIQRAKI